MLDEDYGVPRRKLTRDEVTKHATRISPVLPHEKKPFQITYYRHNGYLFQLNTDRKYIIMTTCASKKRSTDECKFMVRTIGPKLEMKHLE